MGSHGARQTAIVQRELFQRVGNGNARRERHRRIGTSELPPDSCRAGAVRVYSGIALGSIRQPLPLALGRVQLRLQPQRPVPHLPSRRPLRPPSQSPRHPGGLWTRSAPPSEYGQRSSRIRSDLHASCCCPIETSGREASAWRALGRPEPRPLNAGLPDEELPLETFVLLRSTRCDDWCSLPLRPRPSPHFSSPRPCTRKGQSRKARSHSQLGFSLGRQAVSPHHTKWSRARGAWRSTVRN